MRIETDINGFIGRLGSYNRVFIVHDERFEAGRCLPWAPRRAEVLGTHELPSGEGAKELSEVARGWDALMASGADRQTLLLAVGGGATTDVAGFIASTFKRGLDLALVPTTVVGMVDAAIGGKSGINFGGIKNQIGTFHPPIAIGIDTEWLATLPRRECLSGWMEMLKHGYIEGREAVERLHGVVELGGLVHHVVASAETKRRIVEADPLERGPRKSLNFGHTVGHALEAASLATDAPLPHGVAVGYGMAFALRASVELGAGLAGEAADAAVERLRFWLATERLPSASTETLWSTMLHDKKNADGEVREVWLRDWGQPVWDQPLKKAEFERIWLKTVEEMAQ